MRKFNTEGPICADRHYHVPPLTRIDLDDVLGLIRDEKYFVLHGPRQTGKTSALLALRDLLNAGQAGDFRCVYANVEAGQAMRENIAEGIRTVLAELAFRASVTLNDDTLDNLWPALLERVGPGQALRQALARWSMADSRPLVLLIDEIDALVGDTLLSVLRQLRTGYDQRPTAFPHSIVLCGVRDVRDYRIHSTAEDRLVLGGSAFNIKSRSLRMGDFSEQEMRSLTAQHTEQSGQTFTPEALDLIWTRSAGQPWLVNALCREACFDAKVGRDRSRPITAGAILDAQEQLIQRRDTHIDDLANKLREERVRRVIDPILAGADETECSAEDLSYVRDLGLVAQDAGAPRSPRIADPIYAEVVPVLLLRDRTDPRRQDRYWLGADLVVEVVSPDDPDRDLVAKRADYAAAGVAEYWIADPRHDTITVLTLEGDAYVEHGTFARGEAATSPSLKGFAAGVAAVFDAPESGA